MFTFCVILKELFRLNTLNDFLEFFEFLSSTWLLLKRLLPNVTNLGEVFTQSETCLKKPFFGEMKMSLFLMAITLLLTHRFLSLTSHLSSLKWFFFFISSSPLCFPHFLVCFEHQHTCFPLNLMSSLQLFQLVHLSRPNNQQTQKSCAVSQCIPLEPVTCAQTFAADVIRGFARHSDLQRRYNLPVYVPRCNYLCFVLVCSSFKSFVVKDVA